jgi:hypothetical protein
MVFSSYALKDDGSFDGIKTADPWAETVKRVTGNPMRHDLAF